MVAIGSDHRGYALKEEIIKYFKEMDIEYKDFGTYSEERVDSLPIVEKVAKSIQNKECDKGILICGTGFAMTITANKFKGIMCAPCYDEFTAIRSRQHNNANVLAMGAEIVEPSKAVAVVRTWLATEFLGGKYAERIKQIEDLESLNMK
ncbi:MAG: ribose 5-phosphate isomerase B [Firmicutes bacterium]|nr:ribose 5-phosphate isomerase B [Bacillota bacterium]